MRLKNSSVLFAVVLGVFILVIVGGILSTVASFAPTQQNSASESSISPTVITTAPAPQIITNANGNISGVSITVIATIINAATMRSMPPPQPQLPGTPATVIVHPPPGGEY